MGTLTDMFNRSMDAILSWINGIMWLGLAIGIAMIIHGIYSLSTKRQGDGGKNGLSLLIFGAALTSLTALMAIGSETLFGTIQLEAAFQQF